MWPWHLTLTMTDDLDLGIKEKVLSQERNMWNIKALSHTIQKLWPMLTLSQASLGFYVSPVQVFWKHRGKRRNCYEQFLLFPQGFLPVWRTFSQYYQIWNRGLQTLSVWRSLKFVLWERVKVLVDKQRNRRTGQILNAPDIPLQHNPFPHNATFWWTKDI